MFTVHYIIPMSPTKENIELFSNREMRDELVFIIYVPLFVDFRLPGNVFPRMGGRTEISRRSERQNSTGTENVDDI